MEEILIVEPNEIRKLAIIPAGAYVPLMTCTPYGVNSHRMLLRSKRVANIINEDGEEVPAVAVKVTSDAVQVDPLLVVPILASPLVIVMLCFWMFSDKKKKPLPYRNPVYDLSLNLDE